MPRLVERALAAGRLAREQTGVGAGRASIGSVAVGIARSLLGEHAGRALVIGSGDTGAKTARALAGAGMDVTIVAGRRTERACELAAEVGGRAVPIAGLLDPLVEADVVLSCTASPHTLVPAELLVDVVERRPERTLLVFDLAMPRDFDPAARAVTGVQLYDLDDLTHAAQTAVNGRAAAVPAAAALVAVEAERGAQWLASLSVVPTIKRLRLTTEDAVLDALRQSPLAVAGDESLLRAATKAIVARLLHHPTLRLRDAAALGDGEGLAAAAQELFALENP
jgi:glutamyl-tRNA reductase